MKHVSGLATVVLLAPTLLSAEVLLKEDFEGDHCRLLRLAHTNGGDIGDIKVHHFGISDETAAGGKRSFKIDVTIPNGDDVHCTMPVDFPFTQAQDLSVEGSLHAEGGTVSLGFYYRIPAARLSDLVHRGQKQNDRPSAWWSCVAHEPRLHKPALPIHMNVLAVYIRPKPGTETGVPDRGCANSPARDGPTIRAKAVLAHGVRPAGRPAGRLQKHNPHRAEQRTGSDAARDAEGLALPTAAGVPGLLALL